LLRQTVQRFLQLGALELQAPARGGHVDDSTAYLLEQLELPFVGVIERFPRIFGTIEQATQFHFNESRHAGDETHRCLLSSVRTWC
jgi:hypothetical protein